MSEEDEIDFWDIDRAYAHPNAVAQFKYDYIWQCWNGYSPFGTDEGHPLFAGFREWRINHLQVDPLVFLRHYQSSWGVKFTDPLVIQPEKVKELLNQDQFSLHTHDQTTIALAFSQIYVEGALSPHIKTLALCAFERQLVDCVIKSTQIYPEEGKKHLQELKAILLKF